MLGLSAFKRKPRQFTYVPRTYDLEKEAREERRRELFGDDQTQDPSKPYVPGSYVHQHRMRRVVSSEVKSSDRKQRTLTRAIIALVLLALAGYFILTF